MRGTDRSSKSRGEVPCLDPDPAPVRACSCAQISIRGEPEPGFSLKLVPTFVKAPFEHEKFSAAFQIKFDRGTGAQRSSLTFSPLSANNSMVSTPLRSES